MKRVLILAAVCTACVPSWEDQEIAIAIGERIEQGYGRFVDRESEEDGPTWYAKGWPGGRVHLDIYQVTAKGDIAEVERLAREALGVVEGAARVTLRFYELWRNEGGRTRKLLREVTFERGD